MAESAIEAFVHALEHAHRVLDLRWRSVVAFRFNGDVDPLRRGARQAGTRAALVDESLLPLRDGALGRAIIIHGLEAANHLDALMEQAWRVLVPNGRAIFIVPNRRGFWARRDQTPFGAGRPFSSGQLRKLLRRTGFVQGQSRATLILPPQMPVLGICLGHQALAHYLGGTIGRAQEPRHGKASPISHNGDALFDGMDNPFEAGRYHALIVESLPENCRALAASALGENMAFKHESLKAMFSPSALAAKAWQFSGKLSTIKA